jgi:hypothetical protein
VLQVVHAFSLLCGGDFKTFRMILTLVGMLITRTHYVLKRAEMLKFAVSCGLVTITKRTSLWKFLGELMMVNRVSGTNLVLALTQFKPNSNCISLTFRILEYSLSTLRKVLLLRFRRKILLKTSFATFTADMRATTVRSRLKSTTSTLFIVNGIKIAQTQIGDSFQVYSTFRLDRHIVCIICIMLFQTIKIIQ